MIKKIITFLILIGVIIIGFFHNSMMIFAMQNNAHQKMMQKMDCCDNKKQDSKKSCNYDYCISTDIEINPNISNLNISKKILKIKLTCLIDIFSNSSRFFENKNLIKLNSPPNLEKYIKYYSYGDLIKIIKSNT